MWKCSVESRRLLSGSKEDWFLLLSIDVKWVASGKSYKHHKWACGTIHIIPDYHPHRVLSQYLFTDQLWSITGSNWPLISNYVHSECFHMGIIFNSNFHIALLWYGWIDWLIVANENSYVMIIADLFVRFDHSDFYLSAIMSIYRALCPNSKQSIPEYINFTAVNV